MPTTFENGEFGLSLGNSSVLPVYNTFRRLREGYIVH